MTIDSALPKMSYGNGWLFDGDRITGGIEGTWGEHEDGNTGSISVNSDDYFQINISASVGNKIYYADNGTNLALNSTTYTKIRWRYKCSNSDIKAKIVLEFSDASTQTVLNETNSTLFTVSTATITTGKTIDHVRLYANQATGNIYYDSIQIYEGDFNFPNLGGGDMNIDPAIRDALLQVPGRITDIIQHLGAPPTMATCICDLDIGNWKRATDYINAQVFLEVSHNHNYAMNYEPWQWLQIPLDPSGSEYMGMQFKVTVHPEFMLGQDGHRRLRLTFIEYSLANKGGELLVERFGLNL